jgi:hypothetical protein
MLAVQKRGGAPAWRRVFVTLGYDDIAAAHDAVRSERAAAQVKRRTPRQLLTALDELERSLARFHGILHLAEDYRARALPPTGRHALALNELWRFLSIARETTSAILGRASHTLDDRTEAHRLNEAAAAFAVELERAAGPALRGYLRERVDVWTEPAPGLAAATAQRHWLALAFGVLALVLAAGLLWLALGPATP